MKNIDYDTASELKHRLTLRPKEVAEALGVSVRTLARWRDEGTGPSWGSVGPRGAVLYHKEKLLRWADEEMGQ